MENTGNVTDVLRRYLAIMRMIPRLPGKITSPQIKERLASRGIHVAARTIQKDMEKLMDIIPELSRGDRNENPYNWFWRKDANILDLPIMDAYTALTFRLTERFLKNRLPLPVVDLMKPHFMRAREVLEKTGESCISNWPDKIAVIPKGLEFTPPEIASGILDPVYDAIFFGKQITISYQPRSAKAARIYRDLNPLGLVFVDGIIYLVGAFGVNDYPRHFLLHRMKSVELSKVASVVPNGFTLKKHIKSGEFTYPLNSELILLRVRMKKKAAIFLKESPLSTDQKILDEGDEHVIIAATVQDSIQLRFWLKGFGDSAEVIAPEMLRNEFVEMANTLQQMYSQE